jgi:hypothetical protein
VNGAANASYRHLAVGTLQTMGANSHIARPAIQTPHILVVASSAQPFALDAGLSHMELKFGTEAKPRSRLRASGSTHVGRAGLGPQRTSSRSGRRRRNGGDWTGSCLALLDVWQPRSIWSDFNYPKKVLWVPVLRLRWLSGAAWCRDQPAPPTHGGPVTDTTEAPDMPCVTLLLCRMRSAPEVASVQRSGRTKCIGGHCIDASHQCNRSRAQLSPPRRH